MADTVGSSISSVASKDGTRIACWRSGTGAPIVLVHGSTVDHTAWDGVLPGLEPYFTVYTLERRGRGRSSDAQTYALEREFEDVAAVVDSLGGPVAVVGHSYGANCALEATQLTPNISRLVLYEPLVISAGPEDVPAGLAQELDELIAQARRDEAAGLFYQRVLGMSPEAIEQLRADAAWASRVESAHTLVRELRAINFDYRFAWNKAQAYDRPTLFVMGEVSLPRLRASVAALHAVLPNSELVALPGQGHAGLRTAPEMVAAEVRKFLRGSSG
jgi:pimeloyl-ACP methyl ester carboxylesterase